MKLNRKSTTILLSALALLAVVIVAINVLLIMRGPAEVPTVLPMSSPLPTMSDMPGYVLVTPRPYTTEEMATINAIATIRRATITAEYDPPIGENPNPQPTFMTPESPK